MNPQMNKEIKELADKSGCGMLRAKEALEKREGIMEYAEEYVMRYNLAIVCSFETRFPKWSKYLKEKEGK